MVESYMNGISVNGDWYRYHAQAVAAAASMGLVSTERPDGTFGRQYRPTAYGLTLMQQWKVA